MRLGADARGLPGLDDDAARRVQALTRHRIGKAVRRQAGTSLVAGRTRAGRRRSPGICARLVGVCDISEVICGWPRGRRYPPAPASAIRPVRRFKTRTTCDQCPSAGTWTRRPDRPSRPAARPRSSGSDAALASPTTRWLTWPPAPMMPACRRLASSTQTAVALAVIRRCQRLTRCCPAAGVPAGGSARSERARDRKDQGQQNRGKTRQPPPAPAAAKVRLLERERPRLVRETCREAQRGRSRRRFAAQRGRRPALARPEAWFYYH